MIPDVCPDQRMVRRRVASLYLPRLTHRSLDRRQGRVVDSGEGRAAEVLTGEIARRISGAGHSFGTPTPILRSFGLGTKELFASRRCRLQPAHAAAVRDRAFPLDDEKSAIGEIATSCRNPRQTQANRSKLHDESLRRAMQFNVTICPFTADGLHSARELGGECVELAAQCGLRAWLCHVWLRLVPRGS